MSSQNIAKECQQIINLCDDTAKIEERDISHPLSQKKQKQKKPPKNMVSFLLKLILVMDANKYTYIKFAHLKIKSVIIVEIRDINSNI